MRIIQLIVISLVLLTGYSMSSWRDPVCAQNGMVVSAEKKAAEIGIMVMRQGGNAVDAAVAVGFSLAVTYPQAGNIGGGGFMLIRTSDENHYFLDYREKAPIKAAGDMYLDGAGEVIKDASTIGYRASGVPGTVAGLFEAHKRFGKLPWKILLQPAIDLAENGYSIDENQAESLGKENELFNRFPASKAIFTRDGQPFEAGDTLIQQDLAKTLRAIQTAGPEGFYQGHTAELMARDMQQNGGLITIDDLEEYEAIWREPISFSYRGYQIYSAPPPSSGGVLLATCLNTLEHIAPKTIGHNSSPLIHFWIETLRHIYADRAQHLGDSDYYNVPVRALTAKSYGEKIFQQINDGYARTSQSTTPYTGESSETTHFSIVDPEGNAVSNTTTLNGSYGSGVVLAGTGILMNNEMDDFSIKYGYPNMYGLVGGMANAIVPEKRMLSSMTPTIVEKDKKPFLILGSPGGPRIISAVAQVISNVLDHEMNIREAVEMPRFHHQWVPDMTLYEDLGFARDVLFNLKQKGHALHKTGAIGCVQAILYDTQKMQWTGWSDPRQNGSCLGL